MDLILWEILFYRVTPCPPNFKRHVEKKSGPPILKIVTDYSPSDAQQLRLRVEAFLAMIAGL